MYRNNDIVVKIGDKEYFVDFSSHSTIRGSQRNLSTVLKRGIILSIEAAATSIHKNLIQSQPENFEGERIAIINPLLSFACAINKDCLEIITVMNGPSLKLFPGQKVFNIDQDGVRHYIFKNIEQF